MHLARPLPQEGQRTFPKLRILDIDGAKITDPPGMFCFPVDNFGTVEGENPTLYGILALWAVNWMERCKALHKSNSQHHQKVRNPFSLQDSFHERNRIFHSHSNIHSLR